MSSGSFFLIKIPGLEMNLGQYSGTQTVWSVDDEMDDDTGGATRSYTCAFCKRGFSNAQALGGHMNIHRKDRAKLKEAADDRYHNQTLLSLDISREDITAASPSSTSPRRQQSEDSLGSNNSHHHHHQHQHQQPLFVDHPVAEKEREQLLDLELRLGPEPQPPTPDL